MRMGLNQDYSEFYQKDGIQMVKQLLVQQKTIKRVNPNLEKIEMARILGLFDQRKVYERKRDMQSFNLEIHNEFATFYQNNKL